MSLFLDGPLLGGPVVRPLPGDRKLFRSYRVAVHRSRGSSLAFCPYCRQYRSFARPHLSNVIVALGVCGSHINRNDRRVIPEGKPPRKVADLAKKGIGRCVRIGEVSFDAGVSELLAIWTFSLVNAVRIEH